MYGHTNGPRFETRAEIRWLRASGVTAVSQTSGPEAVLAGELGLPYGLVGFPVNYATGVSEPETEEELGRLLALSAEVLTRLVLRTAEVLEEEDLRYDHGYVYRVSVRATLTEIFWAHVVKRLSPRKEPRLPKTFTSASWAKSSTASRPTSRREPRAAPSPRTSRTRRSASASSRGGGRRSANHCSLVRSFFVIGRSL